MPVSGRTLISLDPFAEVMLTVICGTGSEDAMWSMSDNFEWGAVTVVSKGPYHLGSLLQQTFAKWSFLTVEANLIISWALCSANWVGRAPYPWLMDIREWFSSLVMCRVLQLIWCCDHEGRFVAFLVDYCAWHLVIALSNVRSVSCMRSLVVSASMASRSLIIWSRILLLMQSSEQMLHVFMNIKRKSSNDSLTCCMYLQKFLLSMVSLTWPSTQHL